MSDFAHRIINGRQWMMDGWDKQQPINVDEEGGCGVTGFACSIPVAGRHIYEPSKQMHNRGNGKGGGIAAVGMVPEQLGVSREVLDDRYLLQIALLNPKSRNNVEADFITPMFDIDHSRALNHIDNWQDIKSLEVCPPDVQQYFVRVKPDVLKKFAEERGLTGLPSRDIEDEFIYQNSFKLNSKYYAALGDKQAFVLSQGRNMLVLKIVGFAEEIVTYYGLEDFKAHAWIAHQRYPTRGRMWHPGGAHPFCGLNEALVHNGDFANYHSVTEYLAQRNIKPLFLTDTEVAILVFDLWQRVYKYPLEYIIEALAPTSERDFDMLPPEKQAIYRQIQAAHIHASPDGPWFFIIAKNDVENNRFQLMGITDTAMLRPQVFALSSGEDVQIGLICSEKQAIDATLHSLASEDMRFCPIADDYWNSRGGSYTDGGAYVFNVQNTGDGKYDMNCVDKFGKERKAKSGIWTDSRLLDAASIPDHRKKAVAQLLADASGVTLFQAGCSVANKPELREFKEICSQVAVSELSDSERTAAIKGLTFLMDRRYDTGNNKRANALHLVTASLYSALGSAPSIASTGSSRYARADWETRDAIRAPEGIEEVLIVSGHDFPPEGDECDARLVVRANELGWKKFICYDYVGQRFLGSGFGPNSSEVVIDVYGSSGDYLASGADGVVITVHGNAQDQLAQIMKRGKLVVHGDVGQTFMYGAKGGEVFVKGNAAGRPLINAAGKPRAIINGTCLDFLAESFMAGDPLNGGGFVILNGIQVQDDGEIVELESPYSGSNLFSLASGGAIYVRDPHKLLDDEQLNGAVYRDLTEADWKLIEPYLVENERLFEIPVARLLTINGKLMPPSKVYRKVVPKAAAVAVIADDDSNAEWGEEGDE